MKCAALAGALLLGACSTTTADYVAKLQAFTLADLQMADKLAQANGDNTAHACWSALIPAVQSLQGTPQTIGAATALQIARDLTNLSGNIGRACAALQQDVRRQAIGLVMSFGGAAAATP